MNEPSTTLTKRCLNCDFQFTGAYCASCGQKDGPAMPSTKEIAGDLLRNAFTPSGKVWESLWHLLSKPGELTRVYIAGQRRRYVHPVRIYLICVFMLVACTAINNKLREWNDSPRFEVAVGQALVPDREQKLSAAAASESPTAPETGKKAVATMRNSLPP